MRYLDAIKIESPDHTMITCMAPNCELLVPHNEAWQIAITYRHIEDYYHEQTLIAFCCSQACCETIGRTYGGEESPLVTKVRDHDAESARIAQELYELLGHSRRATDTTDHHPTKPHTYRREPSPE